MVWRKEFLKAFLERDLPQLGFRIPAQSLFRFWSILAHYHGNVWNAAEPARALDISQPTVRQYLDLLTSLFMVRTLPPWHENLLKRQVKAPKVYIRDSGLLHQLLGIASETQLLHHPKLGSSWEGYAIEEALKAIEPDEAYFWATHSGAELDLLVLKNGKRFGIEVKRQDAPRVTPSMRIALADLRLEHLTVLYPGSEVLRPRSENSRRPDRRARESRSERAHPARSAQVRVEVTLTSRHPQNLNFSHCAPHLAHVAPPPVLL